MLLAHRVARASSGGVSRSSEILLHQKISIREIYAADSYLAVFHMHLVATEGRVPPLHLLRLPRVMQLLMATRDVSHGVEALSRPISAAVPMRTRDHPA